MKPIPLRTRWIASFLVLALLSAANAATWHVSPRGDDANDGSEAQPFATLPRALEGAVKSAEGGEIVIHAGAYPGNVTIPAPAEGATQVPPLTIRAATTPDGAYEEVVIDGGQRVTEAQLVNAEKGVYFLPYHLANFEPGMWEVRSRTRYSFLADKRAVEAFAGSLAPGRELWKTGDGPGDLKEGVYFRTTDGKPPSAHDLRMARDRSGLVILRPGVTVKGLRFENFQLYFGVCGVSIQAPNVTINSCHAWNCWGGFSVAEGVPDARIVRCTARDVATGVKSYGKNTVVEDCRFFRVADGFVVQEEEQDQCGIQFYNTHVQTARRNLCVGFQAGIFIKASGGVMTLENNTVVAPPGDGERGVGPNTWRPGSVCRGNVIVGYNEPISVGGAGLTKECVVAGNLIWLPANPARAESTVAAIRNENGGENFIAPPLFVDGAREDYRLASNSAGATSGEGGTAIGALGAAPPSVVARPVEAVQPESPAVSRDARIVGEPVVRINDHGAVLLFTTDVPCLSAVQWGSGDRLDRRAEDLRNRSFLRPVPPGENEKPAVDTTPHTEHCIALLGAVQKDGAYAYEIELDSGAGEKSVARGAFKAAGPARTLHVATTGADGETGGELDRPFATLQFAVDRALPGDRIVLAPGVYSGTVWITHGGVAGHPVSIESAEPWGAAFDGKREHQTAIRIGRESRLTETWAFGCLGEPVVSHVRIRGLEIRWYDGMFILAAESTDLAIEGGKFWGRHFVKGRPGVSEGVGARHCERVAIDRNVMFALNTAVRFIHSTGLRLTNNTAAKCFHRVIGIVGARDLYLRNNSFAFGASYLLQIHGVEMDSVDSDYNNFAVQLRTDSSGYDQTPPEERLTREENDFYYGESKAMVYGNEHAVVATLSKWRAQTGQDRHSVFAHPRYADPQNRDFRLLPNSPNLGAGEGGAHIGALGPVDPASSPK